MRTFTNYIYTEMQDKWIDKVKKYYDSSKLPFNNLFHGKLRIVIPYISAEMELAKKKIEALSDKDSVNDVPGKHKGKKYTVDLQNNLVITTGKTSQGRDFERKQNLGSFLQQTKDLSPGLADWWNKKGGAYSIIISRAPIDILRMSDWKHIQSCHSQEGSWFQCALEEAQGNGPIAYMVNKADLGKVPDLQAEEIFNDKERGIEGITPIARLRLRRYRNKVHDYELAIPEDNVFGKEDNDDESMADSVMNWAKSTQKDLHAPLPKMSEFERMGGEYNDQSPDYTMFNRFFRPDRNNKYDYSDEADYKSKLNDPEINKRDMERQLRVIQGGIDFKNNNIYATATVKMEHDEPYISIKAGVNFVYPKTRQLKPLPEKSNYKEFYALKEELFENLVGKFPFRTRDVIFDEAEVLNSLRGEIYIGVITEDEKEHQTLDDFRVVIAQLEELSNRDKYNTYKLNIEKILVKLGYLRLHFSHQVGQDYTQADFKNFTFIVNNKTRNPEFMSEYFPIGEWGKLDEPDTYPDGETIIHGHVPYSLKFMGDRLKNAINIEFEKLKSFERKQGYFQGFDRKDFHSFFETQVLSPTFTYKLDRNNILYCQMHFILDDTNADPERIARDTFRYIQYMDNNFSKIVQLAQNVWKKEMYPLIHNTMNLPNRRNQHPRYQV